MNSNKAPAEKTDKFGYASIMVGDSAALFTKYMEEYGTDYGMAARTIGQAFNAQDGTISQTMVATQRFMDVASVLLPLGLIGAVVITLSSNALLVAASQYQQSKHTKYMTNANNNTLALRRAEHLLQLLQPEAIANLINITYLYGREAQADRIHLVVADSYQAAQLKLFLSQHEKSIPEENKNGPDVKIFDNLQDAFLAVSDESSNRASNKVLIYFHSMVPISIPHDLHIRNCAKFVLRSDVGGQGNAPRLSLTGKLKVSQSNGVIESVAICGGGPEYSDETSRLELSECCATRTDNCSGASSTSGSSNRSKRVGLYYLLATPLVAVAVTMLLSRHSYRRR